MHNQTQIANIKPDGVDDSAHPAWLALAEDSGICVLVLDTNGIILFANDQGGRDFNRASAELIGKAYAELFPPQFGAERLQFIRRVVETQQPLVIDHTYDGTRRRTAIRPYAADSHGRARVLMVCRPTLDGERITSADAQVVQAKHNDLGLLSVLTPRELEILCLIGQGMATAEIAKHLHRSEKTVEWHRVSLGNKLGVSNRVELARIAIRSGLVSTAPRDAVARDGSARDGSPRDAASPGPATV